MVMAKWKDSINARACFRWSERGIILCSRQCKIDICRLHLDNNMVTLQWDNATRGGVIVATGASFFVRDYEVERKIRRLRLERLNRGGRVSGYLLFNLKPILLLPICPLIRAQGVASRPNLLQCSPNTGTIVKKVLGEVGLALLTC